MQQQILRVDFINTDKGIKPRFAPLLNESQIKEHTGYSSLKEMNTNKWKLESIHQIYDDKRLSYQIAIFTKE